jgi:DNA primase
MYSQDLIDDILKHADIVTVISSYINVIKKGRSYVALCPFHDDKNPSLNISKEKQIFKCFVCGTGGNAITFVEKYEKIPFDAAVRKVADLIGYHDDRLLKQAPVVHTDPSLTPLIACINDLEKYYVYALSIPEGEKARDYLKSRNIPTDQIAKYGLGYAPIDGKATIKYLQAKGHSLKSIEGIGIALAHSEGTSDHNAGRLIFPLSDSNGQVVGFSARQLEKDGTSKYINSPDGLLFHKGKILYNYHNVKASAHRDNYCYLLEGFYDVMALEKAGLPNALALMGTSLTADQINLLRRLNCEIRLCLDGDAPGQSAMMKIVSQFQRANIDFRVVSNPGDLRDPDDILQEAGPAALKEAMNHLVDAYDFQIDYYQNTKKLETAEDRRKVMMYFVPFLRNVPAGIDRENYIVKLSKATGYDPDAIHRQLALAAPGDQTEEEAVYADETIAERLHPEKMLVKRLFRAEREVLFYMLSQMDAIKYFKTTIENFYNPVYDEIANYILEYTEKNDKPADVSALVSQIAASGGENSDQLENDVSTLSLDDWWPPYDAKILDECYKVIKEEKEKVNDKTLTVASLEGKGPKDKARLIADYAKRKAAKWNKNQGTGH